MKPDIDSIIKDIVAADPKLGLEASTLRAVVEELALKQPVVTVDAAFRDRLRSELLRQMPAPKESRLTLPWWIIYTVPFGVTAILLLVVQPSYTTLPPTPTSVDTDVTAPATLQMDGGAGKRSSDMSTESAPAGFSGDTMEHQAPVGTNDFFTAAFTPDRTAVRFAYIYVSAPAFILVTGNEGEVLVSNLLLPGEQTNLEIPLKVTVTRGATYTATLYYDNGDGVFNSVDDRPVQYQGMPVSMTIIP
jgi:hypothetical protein